MALTSAQAALDKKAQGVIILDLRQFTFITDYFVIGSGHSDVHVRAIADGIVESLGKKQVKVWHREGDEEGTWILLDYGDIVVHIFYEPARQFYSLERLWADAPQLPMEEETGEEVTGPIENMEQEK